MIALGSVFLDEPVTLRVILGAALVIAGVAVSMRTRAAAGDAAP